MAGWMAQCTIDIVVAVEADINLIDAVNFIQYSHFASSSLIVMYPNSLELFTMHHHPFPPIARFDIEL